MSKCNLVLWTMQGNDSWHAGQDAHAAYKKKISATRFQFHLAGTHDHGFFSVSCKVAVSVTTPFHAKLIQIRDLAAHPKVVTPMRSFFSMDRFHQQQRDHVQPRALAAPQAWRRVRYGLRDNEPIGIAPQRRPANLAHVVVENGLVVLGQLGLGQVSEPPQREPWGVMCAFVVTAAHDLVRWLRGQES